MTVTIRFPRIQEQLSKVKQKPNWGLLDPNWVYVPSAQTDVTKIWRKYGWTPTDYNKEQE
jgi:hypothetical protein